MLGKERVVWGGRVALDRSSWLSLSQSSFCPEFSGTWDREDEKGFLGIGYQRDDDDRILTLEYYRHYMNSKDTVKFSMSSLCEIHLIPADVSSKC